MNIFVLDYNPIIAAQYHVDRHVIKMILESAQMLSTAYRYYNPDVPDWHCYKSTHENHPCTLWVKKSKANAEWLKQLMFALHDEWHYRYEHNRKHNSMWVLDKINFDNFPDIGLTPFALAIKDDCKCDDAVESYKNFYIKYKRHIATWKKRGEPEWWI